MMSWRSRKRQTVLGAKLAPCCWRGRPDKSTSAMSTFASIAALYRRTQPHPQILRQRPSHACCLLPSRLGES